MRILMTLVLMSLAVPAWAAFDTADWTWQRPIEADLDEAGFVRVPIELDVIDTSQPSLNDLRVLDGNGELVPHVVHRGRAAEQKRLEWRDVRLINRTFQPDDYERVILDFGEPTEKNRIEVDVSGTNYRRRVSIEGGSDGETWEPVLEQGWIFDISLPDYNFEANAVDFPRNNFRYLRVTVYHMPEDPERITLRGVKAARYEKVGDKELVAVPVEAMTQTFDDEKKQTIYDLDLGFRNVPVAEFRIETDESYYHRGFEIYGRNAATEKIERKTETGWDQAERDVPWRRVARGVFYRTRHDEKVFESSSVEGLNATYRYLQLRVYEGDNPPLAIEKFTVQRRDMSLVFDYQPGEVYTLIGGNGKAMRAQYDLARAVSRVDEFELPTAFAGAATAFEHELDLGPWSERHGILLFFLVASATAAMLYLVLKNIRQLKEE